VKCGYCPGRAVAWMTWVTIGRPRGAPVCTAHMCELDHADNYGRRPDFTGLRH